MGCTSTAGTAHRCPAPAPASPVRIRTASRGGATRSLEFAGVTLTEPKTPGPDAAEDERFMRIALEEARLAAEVSDEVPIGAVVVVDGEVIARAHNQTRTETDPTAHAELIAVRAAAQALGSMRLVGATVYTTVEPCFMCAGALSHARVARVVWGVRDPKFGGCASLGEVLTDPRLNHQVEWAEGVCADEARELLQSFFRSKRAAKAAGPRD